MLKNSARITRCKEVCGDVIIKNKRPFLVHVDHNSELILKEIAINNSQFGDLVFNRFAGLYDTK